jgi:2,4-dienoyl-CoA reductase-like NADH-dependent reductase (Old Yellow Enzyme family)
MCTAGRAPDAGRPLMTAHPLLFSPLLLRGVTLRNRVVIAPMCQYSAVDGMASDWHFAHLAKLALGGAGLVFTEATAVEEAGRITHGDLGIWTDAHVEPLKRITAFVKAQGAVPAMQLAHAGRKASMQRSWHGNGPLDDTDRVRGEDVWRIVGPSAVVLDEGWLVPHELTLAEIGRLKDSWRKAVRRAREAGMEVVEVHGAHGYLIHSFLSPISNKRTDAYGGSLANRMRLGLEIAEIVRGGWPEQRPVFFRVSSTDGIEGGWTLNDTVAPAKELKARGIDVVDCSSAASRARPQRLGSSARPASRCPSQSAFGGRRESRPWQSV